MFAVAANDSAADLAWRYRDQGQASSNHVHSDRCCKYYADERWCRNGSHCRFQHCQPQPSTYQPYDLPTVDGSQHQQYSGGHDYRYEGPCVVPPMPPPRYDSYDVHQRPAAQQFNTNWRSTPQPPVPLTNAQAEELSRAPSSGHHQQYAGINQTVRHFKRSTDHFLRAGLSALSPHHHHHHPPRHHAALPKQCSYFANGYCRKGERCHYAHDQPHEQQRGFAGRDLEERWDAGKRQAQQAANTVDVQRTTNSCLPDAPAVQSRTPVAKPTGAVLLDELTDQKLSELRTVEIEQLEKRFPHIVREELRNGSDAFVVPLTASDPDWPYDVRMVRLRIIFPAEYPKTCPEAEVEEKHNEELPPLLSKHLTRSVQTWLKDTHANNVTAGKVELIFRPFVRWFDRSMEDLFTEGLTMVKRNMDAEAAGIKFVPFEQLIRASEPSHSDDDDNSDTDDDDDDDYEDEDDDEDECEEDDAVPQKGDLNQQTLYPKLEELSLLEDIVNKQAAITAAVNRPPPPPPLSSSSAQPASIKKDTSRSAGNDFRAPRKGTEIVLRNLQLSETVASIICQKIHITVQCNRCKTKHDIVTDPKRRNGVPCKKCHGDQVVAFRPNLMHPFSAVLGYLDLEGCSAFDLPIVDCLFAVECLACNKPMRCERINYGQPWTSFCYACNAKLTVFVDSAKFHLLKSNKDKLGSEKSKRSKGDGGAAIQEGRPLPNNGTCRHYKKSYRWFRFPCCGKCYACDLCHNEKEVEHEMKFATRVICGFCAKEQPYSSKTPCVLCGSTFNHVGKGHWEGGKGCRDKIRMNREDSHKYSGLGKTVSRKTKETKEKGKKKSTPKS